MLASRFSGEVVGYNGVYVCACVCSDCVFVMLYIYMAEHWVQVVIMVCMCVCVQWLCVCDAVHLHGRALDPGNCLVIMVCMCMCVYTVTVCLWCCTSTWPSTGSCLSSFLPSLHCSPSSAMYAILLSPVSSETFPEKYGNVSKQMTV